MNCYLRKWLLKMQELIKIKFGYRETLKVDMDMYIPQRQTMFLMLFRSMKMLKIDFIIQVLRMLIIILINEYRLQKSGLILWFRLKKIIRMELQNQKKNIEIAKMRPHSIIIKDCRIMLNYIRLLFMRQMKMLSLTPGLLTLRQKDILRNGKMLWISMLAKLEWNGKNIDKI